MSDRTPPTTRAATRRRGEEDEAAAPRSSAKRRTNAGSGGAGGGRGGGGGLGGLALRKSPRFTAAKKEEQTPKKKTPSPKKKKATPKKKAPTPKTKKPQDDGSYGGGGGGNGDDRLLKAGAVLSLTVVDRFEAEAENFSGNNRGNAPSSTGTEDSKLEVEVEVGKVLGAGSHGEVYRAEDSAGTQYVVKVSKAHWRAAEEARNEGRALGGLKGVGGVVQLVATRIGNGGEVILLLEYVQGRDMEEYIEQRGELPLGEACEMMRQLLTAVVEMLKRYWSHLDIKPENILIADEDKKLLLSDFGTARKSNKKTSDDLGSPFFEAPEIGKGGKPYDPPPADVFSIAKTILVALVSYYPRGKSSATGGEWHDEANFGTVGEHLDALRGRCPAAADLLGRMLDDDPSLRPTAEEALEALKDRPWE